jgi:hypothetical protein
MRGPAKYGLGRAGGYYGWDKTRDLFAFGLASLAHNFQVLLGAFSSRPTLPCSDEWHLPNLVFSEAVREIEERYRVKIVEPPVAVPPASYTFSLTIPSPLMIFAVGTKCPKSTKAYIQLWNSNKEDLIEPLEVTFDEGESETIFTFTAQPPMLFKSGYFNINPVDSEMTIGYVNVLFPPQPSY